MRATIVRGNDLCAQAWRNGGGRTRVLRAWPDEKNWQYRISIADIEVDGPFSDYPGVQRCIAVVEGSGVELTIEGIARRLERSDAPLCFDGGVRTTCRLLDGPTRDLNLMLRGARGTIEPAANGTAWRPAAGQCGLFARSEGRCYADDDRIDVAAGALLWFDVALDSLTFVASGPGKPVGWWLRCTPAEERP
ncbi:MAG: HutD family protein [Burkholderiales bacterium]|nr:HutD family protein [Burkholderiales bacterium]